MRNVLFIAPYWMASTQRFILALGRLANVRLLGLCQQKPDGPLAPELDRLLTHLVQVENCFDVDAMERAARGLEKVYGKFHRVIAVLEQMQVPVAELRERLGVEGMGVDASTRFYDKDVMKQAMRDGGLPCAQHSTAHSPEAAREFVKKVGYPVVIKPQRGAGCKATYQVNNEKELEQCLAEAKPSATRAMQIEEFITGIEHTFDTLTLNGKVMFHNISRYSPSCLEVVRNPWIQWTMILPRQIDIPSFDKVREVGQRVISHLGMDTGINHMEWFYRKDGSICVGEIAARPPGAQIMSLMSYAHDVDMWRVWARAVVDGVFEGPIERKYAVGSAYLRGPGSGRVSKVDGLDEAQRKIGKYVVEAKLPEVGRPKMDTYEGDGYAIVRHPDTTVVEQALKQIIGTVRVHYS